MEKVIFEIKSNVQLAPSIFKMELAGSTAHITRPGQFVNIKLEGLYLRRPISVCESVPGLLTIIYKVVGEGTERMSKMGEGEKLDVLTGLGNGYDTEKSGARPLLVGGGVGVPPLYGLAKELIAQGKEVTVVLGFNTKEEIFLKEDFEKLGAKVFVTTVDGTFGTKGFVTAALCDCGDYTHTYSCGPEPMLKALYDATEVSGQFSFEERMGCGFGACMGCTCETLYGNKRICRDGPVLVKEEIKWPAQK